ncbi:glutathione S-transferase family protein [Caulobacter vibrioides CB15]|uniref:Glutathione S-transferase family protein n=2 Tax=Caulobacter vibrioides TaxID=155892 RepID=Q9A831_CAUVC|nr:glutathione S-transferase family protein [Caulobacter vibrioides CB15]ATC28336.1 glutathione S-transferase family protein [Caulobacter vibrioides]
MYTLYGSPSTAGTAIHWMLLELGVPFDLKMLDFDKGEHKTAEYLALNPDGVVPTLIVDGRPVTQMAALLTLLAERHPEAGFAPTPGSADRAAYLSWSFWLANSFQPHFRAWFYSHEPAGGDAQEAVQAAARARIEAGLARLDAHLADQDYMVGKGFTTVDLLVTILCRWSRNMPKPATEWPNLKRYLDRIRQRPALREAHTREGLTDWIDG